MTDSSDANTPNDKAREIIRDLEEEYGATKSLTRNSQSGEISTILN